MEAPTFRLECDLVMKGGITSGVIYPRLVSELSKTYAFRCIGGTSAGAIAAGAAAAAQLGVLAGTCTNAFTKLAGLPDLLAKQVANGSGSMFLNLFQPQPSFRRHFAVLSGALNAASKSRLVMRVAGGLMLRFPFGAVLGAIPGIVLLATSTGFGRWVAVALTVLGVGLGALASAVMSFAHELPGNGFGMCTGMPFDTRGPAALTAWLHEYLNELAGKTPTEPLTFGELWAGKLRAPGDPSPHDGTGRKAVQLATMTTALNLGRPFRMPFESRDFYFVEEEFLPLFPKAVRDGLVTHARPSATAAALSTPGNTFYALPEAQDLPVLISIRMSLSFPVLLSAIPLYTVDRTLAVNAAKPTTATRVLFSDGGICSNFPVHFLRRAATIAPDLRRRPARLSPRLPR